MSQHDLDQACKELLSYFLARSLNDLPPIRYNDLLKDLHEKGWNLSRPTLTTHLEHLTELELVTRTEISRANVNYRFNEKQEIHSKDFLDTLKKMESSFEKEKKTFESLDLSEQIAHLNIILVLRSLYQIKYEILKLAEPEREYEYNLNILSSWSLWDHYSSWLLNNCRENGEDYIDNVVSIIEDMISKYIDITFD